MKKLIYLSLFLFLVACGESYEKVSKSLIKFNKTSQRYTHLDEPFTGIGFEIKRNARVRLYYYEEGIYKKREQGISNNSDSNINIMQEISYENLSEVGEVTYESFYENGPIKQQRVIQEILSKEENSVNTLDKVIKYDKEGNITSTETKEDSIYRQP
tara:strand:+ start:143 stop:613 length:471 start_codon:yes stop_codon:yes gene_type:complete